MARPTRATAARGAGLLALLALAAAPLATAPTTRDTGRPEVRLAAAALGATPPTRPGALSVQVVAQDHAVVRFGRSKGSTRLTYRIRANGTVVATSRRTKQVRVPLACGTVYRLAAVAVDTRRNRSRPSPHAKIRTRACLDTAAPEAPTGLHASSVGYDEAALAWQPSTDPGNGPVTSYLVYRDGVVLGGTTSSTYTASRLRPDHEYLFTVRARDKAGNLSAPAAIDVTTPKPPQATGELRTYLLTSDGESFVDAQRHYRELDWVYPTYFSMTPAGDVTGASQPHVTEWLQDRGIEVLPRFHTENPAHIEAIVTDPPTREAAVARIAAVVLAGGYDGANLDFEMNMPSTGIGSLTVAQRWDRLRNGYSALIEALAARLHQEGLLLSVAVSPNWCSTTDPVTKSPVYCSNSSAPSTRRSRSYLFDYRRIAAAADEVWVMAWGLHWATSEAGPVADVRWLNAVTGYFGDLFASEPSVASRLTLGTNLYGMDWSYAILRTDLVAMPGGTVPTAPQCPGTTQAARPRYSFTGTTLAGILTVDWICLQRFADTHEYADILPIRDALGGERFDQAAAETQLLSFDLSTGNYREVWYVDVRSISARTDLADSVGWRTGFWRLGREDQRIWDLPQLDGGAA